MKISPPSDRVILLIITVMCLALLGWIAIEAINHRVPSDSQTLIGVIVTGLLAFQKDIVLAIRSYWQDEKTSKLTDQLAAAPPPSPDKQVPDSAKAAAQQTADAAQDRADQIDQQP